VASVIVDYTFKMCF